MSSPPVDLGPDYLAKTMTSPSLTSIPSSNPDRHDLSPAASPAVSGSYPRGVCSSRRRSSRAPLQRLTHLLTPSCTASTPARASYFRPRGICVRIVTGVTSGNYGQARRSWFSSMAYRLLVTWPSSTGRWSGCWRYCSHRGAGLSSLDLPNATSSRSSDLSPGLGSNVGTAAHCAHKSI